MTKVYGGSGSDLIGVIEFWIFIRGMMGVDG